MFGKCKYCRLFIMKDCPGDNEEEYPDCYEEFDYDGDVWLMDK